MTAKSRSERAGCDSNEADSAEPLRELMDEWIADGCAGCHHHMAHHSILAASLMSPCQWAGCGCPRFLPKQHGHPREPGMVIGTKCNVCRKPLTVAGCPLCVTCCEREP